MKAIVGATSVIEIEAPKECIFFAYLIAKIVVATEIIENTIPIINAAI